MKSLIIVLIVLGAIVLGAIVLGAIVLVLGGIFLLKGENSKSNSSGANTGGSLGNSENVGGEIINIANFAFSPSELRIKKGESVKWTNQDSAEHTITSDLGEELDSPLLEKGQSYSHTFNQQGTYSYHCAPHSYMKARIIVEYRESR